MKRVGDHRTAYDHQSIDAELRGAYERGRREQRGVRRSPAMPMLLMAGSAVAGAMVVYLALNRGPLPGVWPDRRHAHDSQSQADLTVVSDPAAAAPAQARREARGLVIQR